MVLKGLYMCHYILEDFEFSSVSHMQVCASCDTETQVSSDLWQVNRGWAAVSENTLSSYYRGATIGMVGGRSKFAEDTWYQFQR